jgi:hypothetical protein
VPPHDWCQDAAHRLPSTRNTGTPAHELTSVLYLPRGDFGVVQGKPDECVCKSDAEIFFANDVDPTPAQLGVMDAHVTCTPQSYPKHEPNSVDVWLAAVENEAYPTTGRDDIVNQSGGHDEPASRTCRS